MSRSRKATYSQIFDRTSPTDTATHRSIAAGINASTVAYAQVRHG